MGPAVTVEMVMAGEKTAPTPEQHFVDYNKEHAVMYIHQPPEARSACWGGLMSTRAKYLGAQGVVINGRMRDAAEHIEMGFPVRPSTATE